MSRYVHINEFEVDGKRVHEFSVDETMLPTSRFAWDTSCHYSLVDGEVRAMVDDLRVHPAGKTMIQLLFRRGIATDIKVDGQAMRVTFVDPPNEDEMCAIVVDHIRQLRNGVFHPSYDPSWRTPRSA